MKATHLIFTYLVVLIVGAYPSPPLVFFARTEDDYIPLSKIYYKFFSLLGHGDPETMPLEFVLQRNYAATKNHPTPGFAVLQYGVFSFGTRKTYLDLSSEFEVLNTDFYSCKLRDRDWYGIFYVLPTNRLAKCTPVCIYLLPYNRTSRRPLLDSYTLDSYMLEHNENEKPEESVQKPESDANLQSNQDDTVKPGYTTNSTVPESVEQDLDSDASHAPEKDKDFVHSSVPSVDPLVFFAGVNDTSKPHSGESFESSTISSAFTYVNKTAASVTFS